MHYQLLPAPPPPDDPPLLVLLPELPLPHDEPPEEEACATGGDRRGMTSLVFSSCWQKRHFCTCQAQPSAVVVAACTTWRRWGMSVRCWQAGQGRAVLSGFA